MILYVDMFFAINFSIDFLVLYICSKILHRKVYSVRILSASAIGALYSVLQMIFDFSFLISAIMCITVATVMCIVSYKEKNAKSVVYSVLLYFFVSATISGIMSVMYTLLNGLLSDIISEATYEGTYSGARLFIIIALTTLGAIVFSRVINTKKSVSEVELKITVKDREYVLNGFCDSGNLLVEPFSGKKVILISKISKLAVEINNEKRKRYIPYSDVGGEGIIKGMVPDNLKINNRETVAIIAVADSDNFNGYDALVPSALCEVL